MKIGRFWIKLGPLTQNFAKQPIIFLVPKVKNLKPDESNIFFGHPVENFSMTVLNMSKIGFRFVMIAESENRNQN